MVTKCEDCGLTFISLVSYHEHKDELPKPYLAKSEVGRGTRQYGRRVDGETFCDRIRGVTLAHT